MPQTFTPKFVDMVRNATAVIGTGPVTLGSAVSGYSGFAEACVAGDQFYYCIQGVDKPAEREVGRGTMQANGTIARQAVSGGLTNFTTGTKTISLVAAAEWFTRLDQAGAGVATPATRVALAAVPAVAGALALLSEAGREGLFRFDAANLSSSVTSDPGQGYVVAPASDATGASGAWVRRHDGGLRPEWFGAKGDGASDDSAALNALSNVINALGGGTVELRPGATYRVGGQVMRNPPYYTYYTYPPLVTFPLEFTNCARGVVVRGNGARIKCLDGARYGVFNTDGTPKTVSSGYVGVGASTPYYAMIQAQGCSGVRIEDVELDGNLNALNVNGYFSDSGIQIPASGVILRDNKGPVTLSNVHSHHHGLDGIQVDGLSASATDHKESAVVSASRFECNGRQGLSFVGGKGWSFVSCAFNYTGKATAGSDVAGKVGSAPGAGVDLEAEGVKEIRDILFENCEFIGNLGCGLVADSGTDVDRVTMRECTLIGTTNYVLWPNRPGFKLDRCLIAGTITMLWTGSGTSPSPQDAVQFEGCTLTNDASVSPTGALYTVNNLLIEGGTAFLRFSRCRLVHALPGLGSNGNSPGGSRFEGCEFLAAQGTFNVYGTFAGPNLFINTGSVPGGGASIVGKNDAGPSESAWLYRSGGVTTEHQATVGGEPKDGDKGDVLVSGNGTSWTVQSVSAALSVAAAGAPLTVNSTNGNGNKIVMQDNGVNACFFGGGVTDPFVVADGVGANLLRINWAANVTLYGGLQTPAYLLSTGINGVGYAAGAGGTAVQATAKTTGVTLHKPTGQVTMNGAALAAGASASFNLNNSQIAASDAVVVNIASGATADSYVVTVTAVAAGSCRIQLRNVSAASLSEAVVLNFAVLKGAAA